MSHVHIAQELFHNPPRVRILIGDQGSRDWWADFRKQAATANLTFDIILDDGASPRLRCRLPLVAHMLVPQAACNTLLVP